METDFRRENKSPPSISGRTRVDIDEFRQFILETPDKEWAVWPFETEKNMNNTKVAIYIRRRKNPEYFPWKVLTNGLELWVCPSFRK